MTTRATSAPALARERSPEAAPEPATEVLFSVVVPTHRRPVQLAECLRALSRLRPPVGGFEIVVVNDGGPPPPDGALSAARDVLGACRVRVIAQANAGPAAARNRGAAAARGRYLAFTDDDCLPDPEWLTAFADALRVMPHALVGGRTVDAGGNVCTQTSQLLADFVSTYFQGDAAGRFFTSNNIAVAREVFLAAGGFDTSFPFSAGEDREFCDRWSTQGRPSARAERAVVHHAHPLTPWRFARQHFTYGRGGRTFRRVRAAAGRPVRVAPTFYARSIAHPFTRGLGWRAPVIALLTAGAHAAYASGLVWESLRDRARSA